MQLPNPPDRAPRPPSILLVSEPGVDGVFQYVRSLANSLLDNGWRVHLAYSSVRGCPALHEFVERVRAAGGRTLDLRVGSFPGPADVPALARLRALARSARPEIIHAHSSKAGVLVRVLPALGVRARYFYTPHAYYQMHGPADAKKRFFSLVERGLGQVGITISTSASEAGYGRRVLRLPADRLCVAMTGVDGGRFRPAADPAEKRDARARFGLPPDAPLLGTVARFSEQKDPLTLYRALLDVLPRHPDLCFAHLGKGELAGAVDALLAAAPESVRARIYRVGTSEDTPSFYRALDAFALPSRYEGFALSALEALAAGLPSIVTDCPGNDDLKQYELDAMHWSVTGDAASLSARIDDWIEAFAVPNNHRETMLTRFNLTQAWARVRQCYELTPDRWKGEGEVIGDR